MNPSCSKQHLERSTPWRRNPVQTMRALFGLVAVCGLLGLAGCVAFQIRTQTNTLSESGFLARTPQTTTQREAYAALPPYQLLRGVAGGSPFYVYKNEKAGVVYVGGEEDYQRYMIKVRRLVAFFETTEAKMAAYDMDSNLQALWYRSWGILHVHDRPCSVDLLSADREDTVATTHLSTLKKPITGGVIQLFASSSLRNR